MPCWSTDVPDFPPRRSQDRSRAYLNIELTRSPSNPLGDRVALPCREIYVEPSVALSRAIGGTYCLQRRRSSVREASQV